MILPRSGKSGFMIVGSTGVPLYSWSMNASRNRISYRTSNSENFPKRVPGWISETITLLGVHTTPPLLSSSSNIFKIGWHDFVLDKRKSIECRAVPLELRYNFRYEPGPALAFTWSYNLLGVINKKLIVEESWLPFNETIVCAESLCNGGITTTDSALSGIVSHVKTASIIITYAVPSYPRSDSSNHIIGVAPVLDQTVELTVQGDFDYWLDELNNSDDRHDYKFFHGPDPTKFKSANKMKVTDINNFVVNIQTGEIIQATVMLGASYG